MMVLKIRCLDRGIPFELDTCGIGEEKDLSEYDLIFLGGGADKEQISLIPDLLSRKENIKKAMDEKNVCAFDLWWLSIIWSILYSCQ